MGRRKRIVVGSPEDTLPINYCTQPVEVMCPTLHRVTSSDEMHLFDLASVQLELERVLTNTMERLQCLSAEAKGKRIPATILHSLQLRSSSADAPVVTNRPSLVVKANPNKPLTLIISQQNRSVQSHPPVSSVPEFPMSNRANYLPSPVCLRNIKKHSHKDQMERSPSTSPDKNQNASGYAIPNKFWELMEPYCAELTEANISFLEGLIRSYQDMESTYFQLPPLRSQDISKVESLDSLAPKRPKREAAHAVNNQPSAIAGASNSKEPFSVVPPPSAMQRAQLLDAELKNPISDSSALGKFSLFLLSSCYQENIMFSFTEGIKRLSAESDKHHRGNSTGLTHHTREHPALSSPDELTPIFEHQASATSDASFCVDTNCSLGILNDEVRHLVTVKASQPLKSLAKELHVSSSYRVEKKISQAMAELGLIPLNAMFPPELKAPSPIHPPIKLEDQRFSKPFIVADNSDDKHITKPLEPASATHPPPPPGVYCTSGCKGRSNSSRISGHSISLPKLDPSTVRSTEYNRSPNVAAHTTPHVVVSGSYKMNSRSCSLRSHRPHRSWQKNRRKLKITLHSTTSSTVQNGCSRNSKNTGDFNSNCDHFECNGLSSNDDGLCLNDRPVTGTPTTCEHLPDNRRATSSDCAHSNGDGEDDCSSTSDNNGGCSFQGAVPPNEIGMNGHSSVKMEETASGLVNDRVHPSSQLGEGTGAHECGIPGAAVTNHFTGRQWGHNDSIQVPKTCCDDFSCSVDAPADAAADITDSVGRSGADELDLYQDISHKSSADLPSSIPDVCMLREMPNDEIGRAILQRQRELRVICTENHSVLRRLVQAARRDMQRQEIQRRLAIADADVIEAYNRLESYRPQRKPPLKRDRDSAYKALRERSKILKELEMFDAKPP